MSTLGKNVEYAIHSLVYLIDNPKENKITVKDLANFQNISETYLAKAFTKLKKAGIVKSNIGVKGGYTLSKLPDEITFLDIVLAVEGEISFFECNNIRDNCVLVDKKNLPWKENNYCAIHLVMIEAENKIKETLKEKNLQWVYDTIRKQYGQEMIDKTQDWFKLNVFDSK
ncbi:BadM/Rrf2 family transcriptional regulator [Flavobacterium sp. 90]|uniref:Rrf2 family transcriptional regulator n=1 Tax=unclassified Flavobacterium TaxID=196869 RepID=UPI000EAD0406|nr:MULTISPECIES: Rrf2 family transcriptional regulator [unclassified Flavobacterium]RKR11452.1 BadM/Rrf2 family transcriptional regulator [Flavobacterium sp. 81]TCK55233.1 BadM/Rrf2 family transcriptional regulator [Flavobacterium sp. 90]